MPPAYAGDHAKSKWGYLTGDVRQRNMLLSASTRFNQLLSKLLDIFMHKPTKYIIVAFLLLIVCCLPACNRGGSKSGDIRYEYRIVSRIPLNTPFDDTINKMADDGWRLIEVTHRTTHLNGSIQDVRRDEAQSITLSAQDQYEYIFERPKK